MPDLFEAGRPASRETVADLLRTVADGVETGSVALVSEDARLALEVPADLEYELEVETGRAADGVAVELECELSWVAGDEHEAAVPTGPEATGETKDV